MPRLEKCMQASWRARGPQQAARRILMSGLSGCSLTVRLTDGCTHRSVTNPPGARSRVTVKGGTLEVDIPRGPLFSTERAGTAGFALVLL